MLPPGDRLGDSGDTGDRAMGLNSTDTLPVGVRSVGVMHGRLVGVPTLPSDRFECVRSLDDGVGPKSSGSDRTGNLVGIEGNTVGCTPLDACRRLRAPLTSGRADFVNVEDKVEELEGGDSTVSVCKRNATRWL